MLNNVKWLLFESGISKYKISQETGVPQSTLSRYSTDEADIANMSAANLTKLNDYYIKISQIPDRDRINKIVGECFAIVDYLAKKHYDKDRALPSAHYAGKATAKALHTLELMIKDIQQYVPKFDDDKDLFLLVEIVKGWKELKDNLDDPYNIKVIDGLYLTYMAKKAKDLETGK